MAITSGKEPRRGTRSWLKNSGTISEADDEIIQRGIKAYRPDMMGTAAAFNTYTDEGKKAFKEYCEAQSGEVKTYNIHEMGEENNGKE